MTTLSSDAIARLLAEHSRWVLATDGYLEAGFRFPDFAHALLFVNAVGHLAEAADHHPDLIVHGYRNVTVRVMSHDVQGITDRDVGLIQRVDALPGTGEATP